MHKLLISIALLTLLAGAHNPAAAAQESSEPKAPASAPTTAPVTPPTPDSATEGSVTIAGKKIEYHAIAGTITVGSSGPQDAALGMDGRPFLEPGEKPSTKPKEDPATARMFYVAYFKNGVAAEDRPVTFFFNGGPGSSTLWLHMGAFGPKRVVTTDTEHDLGAPYKIINNDHSLLDVSDVVFIDAPGTGFSRIFGKNKEKAFFGLDQDAEAFERFIRRFLTKHNRWNSPKFLFGESYGTPRSAILSARLENLDLNGIVLLSAILSFDNSVDGPRWNPGVDQPYALALPTFAATAFYHHKLPNQPAELKPFLDEVEKYALGDYMSALLQGAGLPDDRKKVVAEKLHEYTGLPVAFLMKSNLRVSGGAFSKNLELENETTIGRLDTRYKGPDMNPMSEEAEYDPQSNAISAAYTAAINQYLRTDLKYGDNQTYLPYIGTEWDFRHHAPNGPPASDQWSGPNVMQDLAYAIKSNPKMKVLVTGGYYDLATPYFEGMFEMRHLPIPKKLQENISYRYYESGHMVYVNEGVLKKCHDDVAAFIRGDSSSKQEPMPAILQNHYVLAVHDVQKSARFYVDVLGFEVIAEPPGWLFVKKDNCIVMLGECPDDRSAAELNNHSYFGYLRVDDVDAFHQQVLRAGVTPMHALATKPWGMREFGVRTPDGHRIMIGQLMSDAR